MKTQLLRNRFGQRQGRVRGRGDMNKPTSGSNGKCICPKCGHNKR